MQNRLSCAPTTAGEEYICYLLALDLDKNRYIIMMREDSVTGDFTIQAQYFSASGGFFTSDSSTFVKDSSYSNEFGLYWLWNFDITGSFDHPY